MVPTSETAPMQLEVAPCDHDHDRAPIPAAQVAARQDDADANAKAHEMEDAIEALLNSPGDAPMTAAQIAMHYDEMEDTEKCAKKRPELVADGDLPEQYHLYEQAKTEQNRTKKPLALNETHPLPVPEQSRLALEQRPPNVDLQQSPRRMLPNQRDDRSVLTPVAVLVNEDPTLPVAQVLPVPSEERRDPWWKEHQRLIIVVLLVLIAALVAMLGAFLFARNEGDASTPPASQTLPSPMIPSTKESIGPTRLPTPEPAIVGPTEKATPLPRPYSTHTSTTTPSRGPSLPPSPKATPYPTMKPTMRPSRWPTPRPTSSNVPGNVIANAGTIGTVQAKVGDRVTNSGTIHNFVFEGMWSAALKSAIGEEIISHDRNQNVAIYDNTAVVGAPFNDSKEGAVFVLVRGADMKWSLQAKLVAPAGSISDRFGRSVGIYEDVVVVGTHGYGTAHAFVRTGSTWAHQTELQHVTATGSAATSPSFGTNVAIHGQTIVVSAELDVSNPNKNSGAVHIFVQDGMAWVHEAKLTGIDGDRFGGSVGIYEDTVIIGAPGGFAFLPPFDHVDGSAYVFVRSGSSWNRQAQLTLTDVPDGLGHSVGIYADAAVVGAPGGIENGSESGSAHIFARSGATWNYRAILLAPDGTAYDNFGSSVAIHDDALVIGAPGDDIQDGTEDESGSAHVFARNEVGTWIYHAKLLAHNIGTRFGQSVAIHSDSVLVGSDNQEVYAMSGQLRSSMCIVPQCFR